MQARNAFCAVRPPGHHAGPTGIVPSEKDPAGSNGFCLLNNVAIGAAYAMNVYRHAGRSLLISSERSCTWALTPKGGQMTPNTRLHVCFVNEIHRDGHWLEVHQRCLAAGIKKVAILDFDVHHGNGTQACVSSTVPHVRTIDFSTPFSRGVQEFPIYRPWLGEHDVDNIFFAR